LSISKPFINLGYPSLNPWSMKTLKLIFILCMVAFPCLSHAQYILTLHCDQMGPYTGKLFKVRVTETATGKEVGRKTIDVLQTTTFSIDLYVLLQNKSYQVDFYVDVNGNDGYDAPPDDHAWRRSVNNASQHTTINFTPDLNYTNINFPDALPFGTYDAVWGGRWKNLTFGSTDSIEAAFNLTCDSVIASFSTKGVFGNPAIVEFAFADTVNSNPDLVHDTIHYAPGAPWTGEVYVINGEIHGSLGAGGLVLAFTGTLGLKQLICLYTVANGGTVFANGYFYLRELEVIYLFPPLTLELSGMPPTCQGGSDGSVWSEVGGGTGNYEYAWMETGTTTPHIDGVGADTFNLTVSDELGCTVTATHILTEPEPLIVVNVVVEDVSCYGACDGNITLLVTGGVPPYVYTLDGGFELCSGDYTVSITDAVGCTIQTELSIGSPEAIVIEDILITDATNGMANGAIEIIASGGIPPYEYSINSVSFQASNLFSNLPPGSYEVCIRDGNGCLSCEGSIVVQDITAVNNLVSDINWYPNPASSYLHIDSDFPLSVVIKDLQGQQVKYSPLTLEQDIRLHGIPAGLYILGFSDGHQTAYRKLIIQ
jgi:SprB repeat/Secretion system C-terminal sorting domain